MLWVWKVHFCSLLGCDISSTSCFLLLDFYKASVSAFLFYHFGHAIIVTLCLVASARETVVGREEWN